MSLNKHQIFAAPDIKMSEVDMTEEWGGIVKIKVMTLGDKLEMAKLASTDPEKNFLVYTIIKCCVDDNGEPIFVADDEKFLLKKNTKSLLKLYNAISELDGSSLPVEERAKNS